MVRIISTYRVKKLDDQSVLRETSEAFLKTGGGLFSADTYATVTAPTGIHYPSFEAYVKGSDGKTYEIWVENNKIVDIRET